MVGVAAHGVAAGGQTYRESRPAAALWPVVSSTWIQRVPAHGRAYTHRTLPNGSVEVRCRVGGPVEIVGPRTGPMVETLAAGATVVGVRVRPGAAWPALGVPASDLVDRVITADQLWGAAAFELAERVAGAGSPLDAVRHLGDHVGGRAARGGDLDPIAAEAVRRLMPWRAHDIGTLSATLFLSERQLRRRVRTATGLAPKTLHRLLRFQGFVALAQRALADGQVPSSVGLASLAAAAGYADQPHLTRESLRLAGLSPLGFLRESERQCGPGHDHEASFAPLLAPRGPGRAGGVRRTRTAVPFNPRG